MLKKVSSEYRRGRCQRSCHFEWRRESYVRHSMKSTEQTVVVDLPNLARPAMPVHIERTPPELGAVASLRLHWPEYLIEAGLLGAFMVSACIFGILYGYPGSPIRQAISSSFIRGLLGGISMGATALCIFYSPWGKQSGAHINPSVTLTFLRLGKVRTWDAIFYVAALLRRCVWSLISC
jgi:hypothetical protein